MIVRTEVHPKPQMSLSKVKVVSNMLHTLFNFYLNGCLWKLVENYHPSTFIQLLLTRMIKRKIEKINTIELSITIHNIKFYQ